MPRSAGTYTPPSNSVYPAVSNTVINPTDFNSFVSDLSTAVTQSIAVDGSSTITNNIPLNGHKLTGLAAAAVNGDAVRYEQISGLLAGGSADPTLITIAALTPTTGQGIYFTGSDVAATYWIPFDVSTGGPVADAQGRLTLTTAVPVTTSDVTGATTIRYTPYRGTRVPIWDGTNWTQKVFTELSNITTNSATGNAGPAAVTTNSNYDLFVWSNSGVLTLTRGPAWTSDTARGSGAGTTQITMQNGVYTNTVAITNGPGAGLGTYVGTVRSDGSSQINDSVLKRHVWNYFNRVPRSMVRIESGSWTYSSASIRQANGSANNQLAMVRGLDEDVALARSAAQVFSSGATIREVGSIIGLDSTSAAAAGLLGGDGECTSSVFALLRSDYCGYPGLGSHLLQLLEYAGGADTQTWVGSQVGIQATVQA